MSSVCRRAWDYPGRSTCDGRAVRRAVTSLCLPRADQSNSISCSKAKYLASTNGRVERRHCASSRLVLLKTRMGPLFSLLKKRSLIRPSSRAQSRAASRRGRTRRRRSSRSGRSRARSSRSSPCSSPLTERRGWLGQVVSGASSRLRCRLQRSASVGVRARSGFRPPRRSKPAPSKPCGPPTDERKGKRPANAAQTP
jgi:hypothetical protein